MSDASLTLAAIGDVSFRGLPGTPSLAAFRGVLPVFRRAAAVVANLESPLLDAGVPVPGKCTLSGPTAWAQVLRDAGITIVSLANNHMMDFGPDGLATTIRSLDAAGVARVGGGANRAAANAPVVLEIQNRRVAFLARTSVVVSAPWYAAGDETPGVAFLDADETCAAIQRAKREADLVVLLIHWGLEEYRYPSPGQRDLARRFAAAGADMVIGHHPHVTQGVERIGRSVVAYSLGNFLFGEFHWDYTGPQGETTSVFAGLSPENREGVVLLLTAEDGGRISTAFEHTLINDVGALFDPASRRHAETRALSRRLDLPAYRWWWKAYAARREWSLRLGGMFSPIQVLRRLHKIRPRHLKLALESARRSVNVVSQRSTNPYE